MTNTPVQDVRLVKDKQTGEKIGRNEIWCMKSYKRIVLTSKSIYWSRCVMARKKTLNLSWLLILFLSCIVDKWLIIDLWDTEILWIHTRHYQYDLSYSMERLMLCIVLGVILENSMWEWIDRKTQNINEYAFFCHVFI